MDEVLFKIMRTVPELHLVLVLPDCFYTHTTDYKNKISWARKLVQRLWTKYAKYYLPPIYLSDPHILAVRHKDFNHDNLGEEIFITVYGSCLLC